jgi:tRNA pseudouridine32 synthase / 23S rRNA pseudouridine746 synthase
MDVDRRLFLFIIVVQVIFGIVSVDVFSVAALSPSPLPTTLPTNEVLIYEMDGITTIHNATSTFTSLPHAPTGLHCPSTFVSSQFRAAGLRVSFNVPSRLGESMFPLQTYHLKRPHGKPNRCIMEHSVTVDRIKIPSLAFVIQNQHQMNLSISSNVLLQQYQEQEELRNTRLLDEQDKPITDTTVNPTFLLNKIRTEYQAAQPLSLEMLHILYCDEHICVINKPSGVLSVPGPRRNPSIANLVYDVLQPPARQHVDQTVVHRLDMATSGIIVYALSSEALIQLHDDFKERRVYKLYQCLVHGHLSTIASLEGEIDVALERDPNNPPFMRVAQFDDTTQKIGNDMDTDQYFQRMQHKFWREAPKPSLTQYTILGHETRNGQAVTRLELKPLTGRTHQLRVHTAQVLGMPIVGDDIYGSALDDCAMEGPLCLHAQKLCIRHPISGAPMIFQADAPF